MEFYEVFRGNWKQEFYEVFESRSQLILITGFLRFYFEILWFSIRKEIVKLWTRMNLIISNSKRLIAVNTPGGCHV